MANTGCRFGEAVGLRWKHLGAGHKTVWIGESVSRGVRRSTKTGIVHYLQSQLLGTVTVIPTVEGTEEMIHDAVLELVRESIAELADELAGLRSEFSRFKTLNPPESVTKEDLAPITRKLLELGCRLDAHQEHYH